MVENRPFLTGLTHVFIWLGIVIVVLPIYIAFVASTHPLIDLLRAPIPYLPGKDLIHNYITVIKNGFAATGGEPIWPMMWNSFVMALGIAVGKIFVSILSAFAVVYFRFPLRNFFFWLIFITLMLPVQVRILPTFEVAASLHLLNTYTGLTLPLIASATATFLFRQFFLTVPGELVEAARMDGASPMRFFWDILLPLSKTNIAALFIIMFIYGWNQFLWPLVITTKSSMTTIVMGIEKLANIADQIPQWNYIMATVILAMLPPVIIVVFMQRLFVKGLIETEK
ncbi:MAG: sn-glycerol-3-phosphate ABC transporter permease UgpE [Pseudomonadota bacterium]